MGLEALDRRLCLQRVGMGRPENFRLRFENLVQHGSRIVGSALPSKCHGELISGLSCAGMIQGQGPRTGGEDLPEYRFCLEDLVLFGEVAGDIMPGS